MKNKTKHIFAKVLLTLLMLASSFNCVKAEDNYPGDDYQNGYIESNLDSDLSKYVSDIALYSNDALSSKYPENGIKDIIDTYPAIRNQNPYGTCWAFTSIGLLEFDLIKNHNFSKDIDLSEFQLVYNTFNSVLDPLKGTDGDTAVYTNGTNNANYMNNGGSIAWAMKRLSQWTSAVNESEAKYPSNSNTSADIPAPVSDDVAFKKDVVHMQNAYLFNLTENPELAKQMIVEYGAIGTSYYNDYTYFGFSNDNYWDYYENITKTNSDGSSSYMPTNHAIMIVGWDDNYSKDNFGTTDHPDKPTKDGAWLVRNSWGESNKSYFWLSYETYSIQNETAYVFDAIPVNDDYDYNYQLDGGINNTGYTGYKYYANVFNVQNKDDGVYDVLKAVNITTTYKDTSNINYTINVYTELEDTNNPLSGTNASTTTYQTQTQGIYTIELDEPVILKPGTSYSIVVSADKGCPVDYEISYNSDQSTLYGSTWYLNVKSNNNSFISYDGVSYTLLQSNQANIDYGNLCIKGLANDAFSLSFNANGGKLDNDYTKILEDGDLYGSLPTPTYDGYIFEGWYTAKEDGNKVDINTKINKATTLYAHWTKDEEDVTITLNTNGGVLAANEATVITVKKGSEIPSLPSPTKTGYSFDAWYTSLDDNSEIILHDYKVNQDITIYAKYNTLDYYYYINYVSESGKELSKTNTILKTYDTTNTINPIDIDYYAKPSSQNVKWDVAENYGKTIKFTYKPIEYSITYVLNNDKATNNEKNPSTYNIESNRIDLQSPNLAGYTGTWYSDKELTNKVYNIEPKSYGNITLYAGYEKLPDVTPEPPEKYTVTFDANGGTVSENSRLVESGNIIGDLPETFKEGATFKGWYNSDGVKYEAHNLMLSQDITLYAHWSNNSYSISMMDGDRISGSVSFEYGYKLSENNLYKLEKDGYNFLGWYYSDGTEAKVDDLLPANDISIYAKWELKENNKTTIKFNANSGISSENEGVIGNDNKLEGSLPTASRKGYTFIGWFTSASDGDRITSESDLTGVEEVYAHWIINLYTLNITDENGTEIGSKTLEYNSKYGNLPDVSKDGYKFLGWFNQNNEEVNEDTLISDEDVTIMPKFEKEKEDELPKANIPTISLDSGKYNKNVTIKIESSNENEYIIYTVIKDDNNPSGGGGYGSVLYSLNGEEGKTITYLIDAYVMGNGTTKKDSDHVTRTYTISLAKSNNNSNSNNSSSNSSSSSNTQSVTRTEANTPCEEWHNSKNWTWSEKTKTCVYRVTNTSSK